MCKASSVEDRLCWIGAVMDQIALERRAAFPTALYMVIYEYTWYMHDHIYIDLESYTVKNKYSKININV